MSEALERSTRMVCSLLNDAELAALRIAVIFGNDPRGVLGYEKARSLFNQADGTRMNHVVQAAFEDVARERIG